VIDRATTLRIRRDGARAIHARAARAVAREVQNR
jgi:hypothetical protein